MENATQTKNKIVELYHDKFYFGNSNNNYCSCFARHLSKGDMFSDVEYIGFCYQWCISVL